MKRYVIDSVADIREFFADLYRKAKRPFAPEDLTTVLTESGTAVFSKAEVAYFDDVILDCFVFCNDYHLDLHEIAEAVQQEFCMERSFAKIPKPVQPFLYMRF